MAIPPDVLAAIDAMDDCRAAAYRAAKAARTATGKLEACMDELEVLGVAPEELGACLALLGDVSKCWGMAGAAQWEMTLVLARHRIE